MAGAKRNRGRFVKGRSGNPKGRPAKPVIFKPDPSLPASRRQDIMDVANHEVEVTIDGKKEKMSLYKANAYRLGMAGVKDRIAAARFIDLNMRVSDIDFAKRIGAFQINQSIERLVEENARLRREHGPKTSGVVADTELWEAYNDLRFDGASAEKFMLPKPVPQIPLNEAVIVEGPDDPAGDDQG